MASSFSLKKLERDSDPFFDDKIWGKRTWGTNAVWQLSLVGENSTTVLAVVRPVGYGFVWEVDGGKWSGTEPTLEDAIRVATKMVRVAEKESKK